MNTSRLFVSISLLFIVSIHMHKRALFAQYSGTCYTLVIFLFFVLLFLMLCMVYFCIAVMREPEVQMEACLSNRC